MNPDKSIIKGPDAICNYYMHLYGQFEKCVHNHIRTFALSNREFGTHMLVVEMINDFAPEGRERGRAASSSLYIRACAIARGCRDIWLAHL